MSTYQLPTWDDDLGPAPGVVYVHEDTPAEGDGLPALARGHWVTEQRARRSHDCIGTTPHCPGEIRPGELYRRTAWVERPKGGRRGTVVVERACVACW